MSGRRSKGGNLTKVGIRQAAFLTLTLLALTAPHPLFADPLPPEASAAAKAQVQVLRTYIRKQNLLGLSMIPGEVRDAATWLSGGWHALSLPTDALDEDAPAVPLAADAVSENIDLTGTPAQEIRPMQFGATFHHKGFLPMHDAMVMGVAFNRNAFDDKIKMTLRPFYGQNWHSLRHYWGSEASMDIAQRPDGMPWGKITLGYISGDDSLTDHGSGVDLHGDVDLTHNVQFTSGVRQNSADGNSNYIMLRWKMSFDNP